MNLTYEEILEQMKKAYFDECAENVNDNSEIGKRFQSVASELFALSCYGDYIFKQAFVSTATGKFLDSHARVRGCERKSKQRATGDLTFYIAQPVQNRIDIPKGTVCSIEGKPYLQYATVEDGVIPAGETRAVIPAQSVGWGYEYNCHHNHITVMVNAPAGVLGVNNEKYFTGGFDEESDKALRNRIMKHYCIPSNGVNAQSIINAVKQLDFITDCSVASSETGGEVAVYVATKNGALTEAQKQEVDERINLLKIIGVTSDVKLAGIRYFNITVDVYVARGFDKESVKKKFEEMIRDICSENLIGKSLYMNTVSKKLSVIDGADYFEMYTDSFIKNVISCPRTWYLSLNELAVNCFDS